MNNLNTEVTYFLDGLSHPLRKEIERLRHLLINSAAGLSENIKWNGPNYCYEDNDRITMKIQPPKQIQLIFHRGAKKLKQPDNRLIQSKSKLIQWKENDRAIVSFKSMSEIESGKEDLLSIVNEWIINSK